MTLLVKSKDLKRIFKSGMGTLLPSRSISEFAWSKGEPFSNHTIIQCPFSLCPIVLSQVPIEKPLIAQVCCDK